MNPFELAPSDRDFVAAYPRGAMVTVGADGRPKAVKIEAAVVDGRLQSSSHADKVRTRRLRRDPRCSLYFADDGHRWLGLEAEVEIISGSEAPARLLRYFRARDGKPTEPLDYWGRRDHYTDLDDERFQRVMAEEDAVLYRFMVTRAYGYR